MAATKKSAKELAYILYMDTDLSQKEIAARVKVTEKTLSTWVRAGEWDVLKAAHTVTRGQQIKNMLLQLKEINEVIADRPKGERYPSAPESDTIKKITSSIRDLEKQVTLSEYVTVFTQFLNWLQTDSLELAQQVVDYQNEFLNIKAQELNR